MAMLSREADLSKSFCLSSQTGLLLQKFFLNLEQTVPFISSSLYPASVKSGYAQNIIFYFEAFLMSTLTDVFVTK